MSIGYIGLAIAATLLPLALLVYGLRRHRIAVVILAFNVGLFANVVFLAHAVPAAAVTDNSSVFTFENSTTFSPPNANMRQNYTPSAGTATTCPGTAGYTWQCSWTSDAFTSGQTMSAGTAQVDLYASNTNLGIVRKSQGGIGYTSNNGWTLSRPAVANGDVLIAMGTFRGGTGVNVTSVPSGWALVGARVDNGTSVSMVVYSHVASDASSEPSSYQWSLDTAVKLFAYLINFGGLDSSNPIDVEANQGTASDTSHTAPSVTTTVANGRLLTYHSTAYCVTWTPPTGMTQIVDFSGCSQGASSNVDAEINELTLGAAGPTGTKTATSDTAAVGVTKSIALRPTTTPLTCALTAQLSKPIQLRSVASNTAATSALSLNVPSGVVDGDVMIAAVAHGLVATPFTTTAPAGWTLVHQVEPGATNVFGIFVYRRVASGEPVSYSWTFSSAVNSAGAISAYWNVDTSGSIDVETGGQGAVSSTTTTEPGDLLVLSSMSTSTTTFTPPAGMTERIDVASGSSNVASLELADAVQAIGGATGSKTPTPSPSTWVLLALRPTAGSFLGSASASITGPTVALTSVSIATPVVSFASGDRLQVDVTGPNDQQNCGAAVSYDGTAQPSKLTVAALVVSEGVVGLLFLAAALPMGARWWKRRRPPLSR